MRQERGQHSADGAAPLPSPQPAACRLGGGRRCSLREIKLLRHLGIHDNIIQILDIMTTPPESESFHTLYIVTSLFECDLERIISSSQRLTDQHAQYFVYQILRGLKFIHSARVLHR